MCIRDRGKRAHEEGEPGREDSPAEDEESEDRLQAGRSSAQHPQRTTHGCEGAEDRHLGGREAAAGQLSEDEQPEQPEELSLIHI